MANPEHEAILRQGVEAWNQWREDNPDERPNLNQSNLSWVDLRGCVDLSDADLSSADISKADLTSANLSRANLNGAYAIGADMNNANLSKANLNGANLRDVQLIGANLSDAQLNGANLCDAQLNGANLRWVNLKGAELNGANLKGAELRGANLSDSNLKTTYFGGAILSDAVFNLANLNEADFRVADLSKAKFYNANLTNADFSNANLTNTDFSNADLTNAVFNNANLTNAIFSNTNLNEIICGGTIFAAIDLSTTKGLETARHTSASSLGTNTIFLSKGKIPEIFLRGCGVPETLITFLPSMYEEAIVFYSCFISYSHDDKEFAKRLHDRLQGIGIRCWLDEHQLKPGDELHKTIYEGIRVYDKVILCCSETALKSWWVEKEFKNAITKEEDYTETVLIPITLDDYLFKQPKDNWTIGEINRRFVQDFSNWKDHDAFESAFKKVVDALRTDGGKPPPPTPKLTPRK